MSTGKFSANLSEIKWLSHNVISAKFNLLSPLEFKAGQFMMLEFKKNEKKEPKAYSLVNTPDEKNEAHFILKYYDDGIAVNTLKKNAPDNPMLLEMSGPYGQIVCDITPPLFFIATGVGIAPFLSIINDQLKNKKNSNPIRLLFGVREEKDIILKKELDELEKQFLNFKYLLTLSRPASSWAGAKGRVTHQLAKNGFAEDVIKNNEALFYICGSPDMVKEVKTLLAKEKNIDSKRIQFEIW